VPPGKRRGPVVSTRTAPPRRGERATRYATVAVTDVYFPTVTLQVLAALVWLGGMFFFAIAAPVLRRVKDEGVRAELFGSLGRRLRFVGWICVGVLLVTGVGRILGL